MCRTACFKFGVFLVLLPTIVTTCGALYAYHLDQLEDKRRDAMLEAMTERDLAVSSLFASSQFAFAVFDDKGRVKEWNPALVKWSGMSEEDMLGQTLEQVMEPNDFAAFQATYLKVISEASGDDKVARDLRKRVIPALIALVPQDKSKPHVELMLNLRVVRTHGPEGVVKVYTTAMGGRSEWFTEMACFNRPAVQEVAY